MNKETEVDFGCWIFFVMWVLFTWAMFSIILLQYFIQDFIVTLLYYVIIICLEAIAQLWLWTIYWQHLTWCLSNFYRRIFYRLPPGVSPYTWSMSSALITITASVIYRYVSLARLHLSTGRLSFFNAQSHLNTSSPFHYNYSSFCQTCFRKVEFQNNTSHVPMLLVYRQVVGPHH